MLSGGIPGVTRVKVETIPVLERYYSRPCCASQLLDWGLPTIWRQSRLSSPRGMRRMRNRADHNRYR